MKQRNLDVVIDIETLGTKQDAKIIGIGAVLVQGTKILGTKAPLVFHEVISSRAGTNARRMASGSTVEFWSQQSPELQMLYRTGTMHLTEALQKLSRWMKHAQEVYAPNGVIKPWGNGSVFDISILEHASNQCIIDMPWAFWDIRDLRTAIDESGLDKDTVPFSGIKHHALDDAFHEAQLLVASRELRAAPTPFLGEILGRFGDAIPGPQGPLGSDLNSVGRGLNK